MSDTTSETDTVRAHLTTLDREIEIRPVEQLMDIPREKTGDRGFYRVDSETLFDDHVVSGLSQEELEQIRSGEGLEYPGVWNELLSHLLPDKFTQAAQDPTLPDPVKERDQE